MSGPVLVVVEDSQGELSTASREAVAEATRVGVELSASVEGALLPVDATPEGCAAGLDAIVEELKPVAVLAPGSERGTETMAHLAARLGLPLAANCTAVNPREPMWIVTRSRGGGVLLEDAELDATVKLVTIAPGSASANETGTPPMRQVPVPSDTELRARIVDRTSAGAGVTLATAPVVVSGGRGIGSAEGFAVLEELAELLGGAVGCSRVATNNGWRPHSDQVGQTGTKVAPTVYIAAGISGATQHWAGCMSAENIIAINTDAEAPMVTRSDYAVIGDAQEVLRAVADELRRRTVSIE